MIIIDKSTLNTLSSNKLTLDELNIKRKESMSSPFLDILISRIDMKLDKLDFEIIKIERKKHNTLLNMFRKPTTVEVDSMVITLQLSYDELNEFVCCSDTYMVQHIENYYKSNYESVCSIRRAYYSEPMLKLSLIPFA